MQNLTEMNRLWIRMQYESTKERSQIEADRKELVIALGENLILLSSLESVDAFIYQSYVLPRLLELIHNCKDTLSQQCLLECIMKTFSDEFHAYTLEELLVAFSNLRHIVKTNPFFISLANRLSLYAIKNPKEIEKKNKNLFGPFQNYIERMLDEEGEIIELDRFLDLEIPFLKFSISCYPKNFDNVKCIIEHIASLIQLQHKNNFTEEEQKGIAKLLGIALKPFSIPILDMQQFTSLLNCLPEPLKIDLTKKILIGLGNSSKRIKSIETADKVINLIMPLIDMHIESKIELEDIHTNIAKITHLIQLPDPQQTFFIIMKVKEIFSIGGAISMKYTYPALAWELYCLGGSISIQHSKDEDMKSLQLAVFQLAHHLVESIVPLGTVTALKLFLQGALTLNSIGFKGEDTEKLLLKYLYKAFAMYKEELDDKEEKYKVLVLMIGTLDQITLNSTEKHIELINKVIEYVSSLKNIKDQLSGLLMCSHLCVKYPKVILLSSE